MSELATRPGEHAAAVTPSDVTVLNPVARGLYVGSAGNIAVETASNDVVTLSNVVAGSVLPVSVRKVMSTGTTASSIVALW